MRISITGRIGVCVLGVLFLAGCGGGGSLPEPEPDPVTVSVVSPNGGETWTEGLPATVTWVSEGYTGNVDIECSMDSGATWTVLVADTPNDGTEGVGAPLVHCPTARIQVSAADGDPSVAPAPADQSDADFEIQARIEVTSPNGGELWVIDEAATVTWTWGSYAGNVDIDYSTDGGATWSTLVADTPSDGTADVIVPRSPSCMMRVQVSAADGNPTTALAPSDRSDANARIGGVPYDIGAGLPDVAAGALAWGDYDNDGDLDVAIAGFSSPDMEDAVSFIYRNDGGGTFTDIEAGLPGVGFCSLAWGDYDQDGDLDLALAGVSDLDAETVVTLIYRNDGAGTFTDIGAGLPGAGFCSLAWGDYDDDGDLDLAQSGWSPDVPGETLGDIYRNDGGTFIPDDFLPPFAGCSLAWGDYDNEGDIDLALAGWVGESYSLVCQNDDGWFDEDDGLIIELPAGVQDCSVAWGDYDDDGDLDLALAGYTGDAAVSVIYRNDGEGVFTDIEAGLTGVEFCSLAWGDYDNDGDLDLALAGISDYDTDTAVTLIYRNDGGGTFTDLDAGLTGVGFCSLAWGDYDDDGDLDLAVTGTLGGEGADPACFLYRNDGGFCANTPPGAPTGVAASHDGTWTHLTWTAAVDAETPSAGLSYNLRVGLTATDDGSYPSMASALGVRRIPALGPIVPDLATPGSSASARLELSAGDYYASVQAIDAALEGGPWSVPVPFTVP